MFRKPRRAYRGIRKDESDEECESISTINNPPASTEKAPSSLQSSGGKPNLSFGDDLEENETFKVKRSAHSRRVLKQLKEGKSSLRPNTPENQPDSTVTPTPERVNSYPVKLSESVQKTDTDHEDETIKVKPLQRTSSEQFSSMLKQGVIPDANIIHMARKQRQQAKFQLEAEEEENSSPPPVSNTDASRLVREDDDDDEEEDDDGVAGDVGYENASVNIYKHKRPAFTVTAEYRDPNSRRRVEISRGLQRRRDLEAREGKNERRSMIEAAENENEELKRHGGSGSEDNRDEDDNVWERQQIQKAISNKNSVVLEALVPSPPPSGGAEKGLLPKPRRMADFGDITLSAIKASLEARLKKKQTAMQDWNAELLAVKSDLANGQQTISDSRLKLPQLANTLAFYMELREYVRDVIACLNEKMPKIEYMDTKSIMLYRERSDVLLSRRRADLVDMADELAGSAESSDPSEDPKLTEARRRRKADREARRARRQRQKRVDENLEALIGVLTPSEGVSSDEEEPQGVLAKRAADFADIKNDAEHLFDDVVEEFCTIPSILHRFSEWRERVADTYAQAFIPMCLPQLLAPLVRIQMLAWNPLEEDSHFDQYPWFTSLLDYFSGLTKQATEGDPHGHPAAVLHSLATSPEQEISVIPLVIEKVLVPRLTEIVSASWDPMSRRQTQRLVCLVRTFSSLWPTFSANNKATVRLFEASIQRMEQTIQKDVFIPLLSKMVMSDLRSSRRAFFNRQLNAAMKLYSNLLQWHDLLAPAALKHITFTCLVNRYILVGFASLMSTSVEGGGGGSGEVELWREIVARLTAVVGHLPTQWLCDGDGDSDDKLDQLRRFVNQLVTRRTPETPLGSTVETKEGMLMKPLLKKLKRLQDRLSGKMA